MALGPGKYDDLCTAPRLAAKARGAVLLMVIGGERGDGFSVLQAIDYDLTADLPALLRSIARQIEDSFVKV